MVWVCHWTTLPPNIYKGVEVWRLGRPRGWHCRVWVPLSIMSLMVTFVTLVPAPFRSLITFLCVLPGFLFTVLMIIVELGSWLFKEFKQGPIIQVIWGGQRSFYSEVAPLLLQVLLSLSTSKARKNVRCYLQFSVQGLALTCRIALIAQSHLNISLL